ncbi:MAG TPA: ORF6N domain-containing protein [Candidatus Kapabacteria bacterium]|nr:ORF6N domain-containing protein [Candidatus Kapabacteria bacterium]
MSKKRSAIMAEPLDTLISVVREERVIFDADLARLYGVTLIAHDQTGRLNEAVKRNIQRFPADFAFQLSEKEYDHLISQFAISSSEGGNLSQFATGSQKHRDPKKRPWAFTEHGALMAANILRSERAIEMSLFVIRAFVKLRQHTAANAAILTRLAEIDSTLLLHDHHLRKLYEQIIPLLQPPQPPPKRRIGFRTNGEEDAAARAARKKNA